MPSQKEYYSFNVQLRLVSQQLQYPSLFDSIESLVNEFLRLR